ncbi:hypothetical protein lerEdw1_020627 [Lerista edwardsae]|nr:hypothetical protein lerEdw1_020627 [Lerista edwardsae]
MDGHATSEGPRHRRQPLPALGLGPWREDAEREGARAYLLRLLRLLRLPWRPEHPRLRLVPLPPPPGDSNLQNF